MNSPATPARQSRRHIAELTAFRFATTPTAATIVRQANKLNRKGATSEGGWLGMGGSGPGRLCRRLFSVPFQEAVRQGAAQLVEPVLVVDHFLPSVTGHRILTLQK